MRFVQITQAFDPEATRTLGQAFDMACALLGHTPQPTAVREAIAKSIEAAKDLREAGLAALSDTNAAQPSRRHRSLSLLGKNWIEAEAQKLTPPK
jgi:hypothetical protein